VNTEELIRDQERGVDLEYCVVGVNKAGVGNPSAVVEVTL
jgi:hypothetical protein